MEKEVYEFAEMEVVLFEDEDVITTSAGEEPVITTSVSVETEEPEGEETTGDSDLPMDWFE